MSSVCSECKDSNSCDFQVTCPMATFYKRTIHPIVNSIVTSKTGICPKAERSFTIDTRITSIRSKCLVFIIVKLKEKSGIRHCKNILSLRVIRFNKPAKRIENGNLPSTNTSHMKQ